MYWYNLPDRRLRYSSSGSGAAVRIGAYCLVSVRISAPKSILCKIHIAPRSGLLDYLFHNCSPGSWIGNPVALFSSLPI